MLENSSAPLKKLQNLFSPPLNPPWEVSENPQPNRQTTHHEVDTEEGTGAEEQEMEEDEDEEEQEDQVGVSMKDTRWPKKRLKWFRRAEAILPDAFIKVLKKITKELDKGLKKEVDKLSKKKKEMKCW